MSNLFLATICTFCAALVLTAQTATVVRDGSIEVGLLAGDTIGGLVPADIPLANFSGFRVKSPGRGVIGVSVAIAAKQTLLFYGQISAFKGAQESSVLGGGFSASTNLLNIAYEGGFERLFPIKGTRFALYALGAGATIQKRVDAIVNFVNPNALPAPTDVLAGATRVRLKKAIFAPAAGVGFRCYLGRRFGLRVEAKSYFPTADVVRPSGVASAGIFLAFPPRLQ